jgi:molybdopterin-guanine dinucleotide biosynthesis protein A
MATGIILAGGASKRMPGDKAFMAVSGRRVLDTTIESIRGLFDQVLIVGNAERVERLGVYEGAGVRVVAEPVSGKGPLGGILSGLILSGTEENFVLACDMPFIRREAVAYVLERLDGFQVAVPRTPKGLEPMHAAYHSSCAPVIERQLEAGNLKVTDFFREVRVEYIPWEELLRFDPTGRLLMNINEPEDMRHAAGLTGGQEQEGDSR